MGRRDASPRRAFPNKDFALLVEQLIDNNVEHRFTKKGILFIGPQGSATVHFTSSDTRALKNFKRYLKHAGIDYE